MFGERRAVIAAGGATAGNQRAATLVLALGPVGDIVARMYQLESGMAGLRRLPGPLALCLGSLAVAQPAAAPGLTATTPVFSQLVMFTLPAEFRSAQPTYEKNSGSFYIREQVPEGETLGKWSRMLTLSGARGLAGNGNATPQAMLARMSADFQRNCPESFASAAPGAQKVDGYDAYEVIVSCGRVGSDKGAYGESAVMLTLKGTNDYYTLQWTERGRDSSGPPRIDVAYWNAQLARLSPIRLCPIVPGEAAPYHSCAARQDAAR
ncbi:MAG: hypothetical protein JO184_06135 [Gammaproteobacteria bacterium]|nr:hypothetical protein [Gammaproteobacteria bacterium]